LENLILQRGNTQRPQPPIRLRDIRPPRRPCPVASRVQPTMQILKIRLQVLTVGFPRHSIHPRRGLRADRPVRRPETINTDMVQQRCEPRFLVSSCYLTHTHQPTGRTLPGTASQDALCWPCSPWPDRGRDRPRGRPPAQIPACAASALGSCLGYERRSVHLGRGAGRGRVVAIVSPGGSSGPSSGGDAGCDYVTLLASAWSPVLRKDRTARTLPGTA
jgi:hypothetical protein